MRKSHIAIACLLAAGLMAPGVASARGTDKQAADQSTTQSTTTATPSSSSGVREAMSDAAITTKVKAEMAKDKGVSAMSIKVDTDNGVVKLSGTARSQQEKDRAADIAKSTKGVVSVDNNIQVATASTRK